MIYFLSLCRQRRETNTPGLHIRKCAGELIGGLKKILLHEDLELARADASGTAKRNSIWRPFKCALHSRTAVAVVCLLTVVLWSQSSSPDRTTLRSWGPSLRTHTLSAALCLHNWWWTGYIRRTANRLETNLVGVLIDERRATWHDTNLVG